MASIVWRGTSQNGWRIGMTPNIMLPVRTVIRRGLPAVARRCFGADRLPTPPPNSKPHLGRATFRMTKARLSESDALATPFDLIPHPRMSVWLYEYTHP